MSFMPWNDEFITGIDKIDQQHRWLVNLTNALYDSLHEEDETAPPIGEILERLVEYTMNHFVVEEALFERLGYPQSEAHRAEHDRFNRQVMDLLLRHESGEAVDDKTLGLLKDWLTHHILKVDKAYVGFFHEHGI
ncbi:bacteriohemerythrin [Pseudomonas panipatensis]|uniref:bacteriohemerythrin n=1 Tax=Pseudomonas panipatensis TaxID=428992 RepID=UPI0035B0592C